MKDISTAISEYVQDVREAIRGRLMEQMNVLLKAGYSRSELCLVVDATGGKPDVVPNAIVEEKK